jgi:dipeptidyl-peptidase 4
MNKHLLTLTCLICCLPFLAKAQDLTPDDYQRADAFRQKHFQEKSQNLYVNPQWFRDSTGVWYRLEGEGTLTYQKVAFPGLDPEPAFDHERLAQAINEAFGTEKVRADSLPLGGMQFITADSIGFTIGEASFACQLRDYTLKPWMPVWNRGPLSQSMSPDSQWVAFAKNYNLYLRSVETGEEIQLSTDGTREYAYASYYGWGDIIEGENGERPENFAVNWSPDSKKIICNIVDTRVAEKMYLLDWSVDSLFRPRLLGYYRGSPGDSTMVYYQQVLFDIGDQTETKVDLPPAAHIVSPNLRWMPDGERLVGRYYERGYQARHYVEVDASTGKVRTFHTETSKTSVNNAYDDYRLLEDRNQILFTSERSGWNHLYLLDIATGECKALTQGAYLVSGVKHVDDVEEQIYFTAMGKDPGRNIYYEHLYRVDFAGRQVDLLTPENAHHQVAVSPDGNYFVDNYSTTTQPTVTILRRTDQPDQHVTLNEADVSGLLALGWRPPETYVIKADDGVSDIYCAVWKPTNFDPSRTYPVVEYSYTGPFTYRYPRAFRSGMSGTNQSLAELGFIVITIDGRGSAGRSKAFRDVSYKRLGYGLGDHVYAIRELGERFDWFDADRVGIFGHSAGGYDAARGLLQYPDTYKVGVASSGDHDHRMEKAWWPEMYMGWPVDSAYHQQSNITNAHKLEGKLLLVHGGIDENVNPSATFKLSEALIRADKDFDLLIIPSQRHGYGGLYGDYFTKKRWNYFVEHLKGVEPLWTF